MGKPFQKGQSGNPKGRPVRPEIQELRDALKIAKEKNDKSFIQHYVERAYEEDKVAIALANKILPDLSKVEGSIALDGIEIVIKRDNGKD